MINSFDNNVILISFNLFYSEVKRVLGTIWGMIFSMVYAESILNTSPNQLTLMIKVSFKATMGAMRAGDRLHIHRFV